MQSTCTKKRITRSTIMAVIDRQVDQAQQYAKSVKEEEKERNGRTLRQPDNLDRLAESSNATPTSEDRRRDVEFFEEFRTEARLVFRFQRDRFRVHEGSVVELLFDDEETVESFFLLGRRPLLGTFWVGGRSVQHISVCCPTATAILNLKEGDTFKHRVEGSQISGVVRKIIPVS